MILNLNEGSNTYILQHLGMQSQFVEQSQVNYCTKTSYTKTHRLKEPVIRKLLAKTRLMQSKIDIKKQMILQIEEPVDMNNSSNILYIIADVPK